MAKILIVIDDEMERALPKRRAGFQILTLTSGGT